MRILITGAGGYLAWELVRQLSGTDHDVLAATSNPERLQADAHFSSARAIANEQIFALREPIDAVIHTAFCRKSDGAGLCESLDFSRRVFEWAAAGSAKRVIHLSSQSVYGSSPDAERPDESGALAPGYLYALAKAASEQLLRATMKGSATRFTSVRLASLIGPGRDIPVNIVSKFIQSAMAGRDITIRGGAQRFSFLDVRDAADALIRLLDVPDENLAAVYNLGPNAQTSIQELATLAVDCAERRGLARVNIEVIPEDAPLNSGMDSGRIRGALNWRPRYTIADTVEDTCRQMIRD